MLDKSGCLCYTTIRKRKENKKEKENKKMTYTISHISTDDSYGVHVGVGTMYNMSSVHPTYERALEEAISVAKCYKVCFPSAEVKVVMDNGLFNPPTELMKF